MPSIPTNRLDIPGLRDRAVKEYCAWQQSKVEQSTLKVEYQKACDVIIEDGMDLELIHRDPNAQYLMDKCVKRGVAEHIVNDIDEWVQEHKRARTEE
ncbi:urea carboxylase protein [Rutstroemia sp. NJR-2017a BBW]|nr:urea carboxylase protein [Rutstroemia sp. NJR-2017a BBW]